MSKAFQALLLLILVASVVLAGVNMVSYANRENFKRRWDLDTRELKKDLDGSSQALANATKDRAKAEAQATILGAQISDLQSSVKELENKLLERDQAVKNSELSLKKRETDYNALNENFMAQSKSLEMVRSRNAELTHIAQVSRAVAFNLNVKLAEVEDDLNNAQAELTRRGGDIKTMEEDLKRHKALVALVREQHPSVYNQLVDQKAGTKVLEGVVATIKPNPQGQQDLVMLTIGAKDAVEEGIEFILYRGADYIVKVRAERVMDDMVACRIVSGSWNTKNLQVQQGDLATNRL